MANPTLKKLVGNLIDKFDKLDQESDDEMAEGNAIHAAKTRNEANATLLELIEQICFHKRSRE